MVMAAAASSSAMRALQRARLWLLPSSCCHGCRSMSSDASPPALIPGRADAAGTSLYAQKIGSAAGNGHFRHLKVGGQVGDLALSSLGIGTFLGADNDVVDREYIESITKGLTLGINVIDSASNYRNMRSELAVGQCLSKAINQGIIKRNEVVVCTKGGFLAFDYREDIEPRTYIEEKYIKTGLFQWSEFVGGCHSLSTPFLKNQLELSRRNLGLETIDIYFIHNPEIELAVVPRQQVLSRLKNAFAALEEFVDEGKITMYGIASWNAFRTSSGSKNYMALEELVSFAREIGGENHHFRVVQVPLNLRLQESANSATQNIRGRRLPLIHAAHHLGLSVICSSSLNQANLCKGLPAEVRDKFPELGDERTDAHCALQFVRTTPGVLTALAGMSKVTHVEENAGIIRCPANSR